MILDYYLGFGCYECIEGELENAAKLFIIDFDCCTYRVFELDGSVEQLCDRESEL